MTFDGVWFSYEPARPVLHDITFDVAACQTVALVGRTGAGKTTIANLIPRFYEVGRGAVRIDGYDVRGVTRASLRRQMAMVLQEPFLFRRDRRREHRLRPAGRLASADPSRRRLTVGALAGPSVARRQGEPAPAPCFSRANHLDLVTPFHLPWRQRWQWPAQEWLPNTNPPSLAERTGQGGAMIQFTVNGSPQTTDAPADTPLLWVLREGLKLTGTKFGCGAGLCGACMVHIDGARAFSCQTQIGNVEGHTVTTIEGLSADSSHPVQQAWLAERVPQCGYCQSGQIMSAADLLQRKPHPTRSEIVEHMSAHICRCGTYQRMIRAIERAAREA